MRVRGCDSSKKAERRVKTTRRSLGRSEDMIARVEQVVMEDRRLTVRQIAANTGISKGDLRA